MKLHILTCLLGLFMLFTACDAGRVFERNEAVPNASWNYNFVPTFLVDIKDTSVAYNVYVNFRHNGNYKYSNLYVVLGVQAPQDTLETNRYEFKIANPDGEWLGASGVGGLYYNQIRVLDSIYFPKTGVYQFTLEQNMRDNPLEHIEDVGIRVEKFSGRE